jgi:hypothetical protein
VLLAFGMAVLIAWTLRDRAAYLNAGAPSLLPPLPGGGHHDGTGDLGSPPPPIVRETVANYAGLIMVAAHLTIAGVLGCAALTRRLTRRLPAVRDTGTALLFAVGCALWAALMTMPTAALSIGNAITFANTLAASITVLQYSFVLVVAVTVLVDLRLNTTPIPE